MSLRKIINPFKNHKYNTKSDLSSMTPQSIIRLDPSSVHRDIQTNENPHDFDGLTPIQEEALRKLLAVKRFIKTLDNPNEKKRAHNATIRNFLGKEVQPLIDATQEEIDRKAKYTANQKFDQMFTTEQLKSSSANLGGQRKPKTISRRKRKEKTKKRHKRRTHYKKRK